MSSVNPTNEAKNITDVNNAAGSEAVQPSYIMSDIQDTSKPENNIDIANISATTTSSSTTQANVSSTPDPINNDANYVHADVNTPAPISIDFDQLDMNSIDEVNNANLYIDPSDTSVQALLTQLKDQGIITDEMSDDEIAVAIHNYIVKNFNYVTDKSGDKWNKVAETIANGGGDCEDLANLEASLLTAALLAKGVSLADASKRVSCIVIKYADSGEGHVYVRYIDEDGEARQLDPTVILFGGVKSIDDLKIDSATDKYEVLFTYNSETVTIIGGGADYSTLVTADIAPFMPAPITVPFIDSDKATRDRLYTMQSNEASVQVITVKAQEALEGMLVINKMLERDLYQAQYDGIVRDLEKTIKPNYDDANYKYHDDLRWFGEWKETFSICGAPVKMTWDGTLWPTYADWVCCPDNAWACPAAALKDARAVKATHDTATTAYDEAIAARDKLLADRNKADADYQTLLAAYKAQGGTDASLQVIQADILIYNATTGYYEFDPSKQRSNVVGFSGQVELLKASTLGTTLAYEAMRDLRNVVEQELHGDEGGNYKGMDITKTAMASFKRTEGMLQMCIANALKMMATVNQLMFQNKINATNDAYDQAAQNIQDAKSTVKWYQFWKAEWWTNSEADKQTKLAENEVARNTKLKSLTDNYQLTVQNNMNAAISMLSSMGASFAGGNIDNLSVAIKALIDGVASGISGCSYVDDDGDDAQYLDIDSEKLANLRQQIVTASVLQKVQIMARQTMAEMRNLAHQELTGVSGRQSRGDVAEGISEEAVNKMLTWFDSAANYFVQNVQLKNQSRYYQINIDKMNDVIEALKPAKTLSFIAKIVKFVGLLLSAAGTVLSLTGVGLPVGAALLFIGAMVNLAGGLLDGIANLVATYARLNAEEKYNDVIKPADYTYDYEVLDTDTGIDWLDAANLAQNNANAEAAANNSLFISGNGDGYANTGQADYHSYSGTYSVDTPAFQLALQKINASQMIIMIANSIRRERTQLRNLIHMEMSGVGGRESSNMVTAALQTMRGQMSFVTSLKYQSIMDQMQAKNQQSQRSKNLAMLKDSLTGAWIGLIPIAGNIAQSFLNTSLQKHYATNDSKAKFNTSIPTDPTTGLPTLNDAFLDEILNSSLTDTGNGTKGVDFSTIFDVRDRITKGFLLADVQASIKQAEADMRRLAHMEMTGMDGVRSGDFARQANQANFEVSMKGLNLLTKYLQQKADISNKVMEANKLIDKLNTDQIWNAINATLAVLAGVFTGLVTGDFTMGLAMFNVMEGVVDPYRDYKFAQDNAKNDMGELTNVGVIAKLRETMKKSLSSSDSRLAKLEMECMEEIITELMQSLGSGKWGVNSSLSSKYQMMLKKEYRAEETRAKLQSAIQSLRNIIHQTVTGNSGASSDVALSIIAKRQEDMAGKIDDLFSQMDQVADRHNEIVDAKKQAEMAKVAMNKSIAKSLMSAAILVTQTIIAAKMHSKQQEIKELENKVKADPANSYALSKQLGDASKAMNTFQSQALFTSMLSSMLQATLSLIYVEKQENAMEQFEHMESENLSNENAAVAGQNNMSRSAQDSSVVNRNSTGDMDTETLIAEMEVAIGQGQLVNKSVSYRMQHNDDMRETKNKWSDFTKDIAEAGKDYLVAKGVQKADAWKKANKKPAAVVADRGNRILERIMSNPIFKKLSEAVKAAIKDIVVDGRFQEMTNDMQNKVLQILDKKASDPANIVKNNGLDLLKASVINDAIEQVSKSDNKNKAENNQTKIEDMTERSKEIVSAGQKMQTNLNNMVNVANQLATNQPTARNNTALMSRMSQIMTEVETKINKIQKNIDATDAEMKEMDNAAPKKDIDTLKQALKNAQAKLKEAQAKLNQAMDKLKTAKQKQPTANAQLVAMEKKIKEERDRVTAEIEQIEQQLTKLNGIQLSYNGNSGSQINYVDPLKQKMEEIAQS